MKPKFETNALLFVIAMFVLVVLNSRLLAFRTPTLRKDTLAANASNYAAAKDVAELPRALVLNEKLNAMAAEIVDLQNKKTVLNYSGSQIWPAASLTKLMSAVIVKEILNPDEMIEIPINGPADDTILPGEIYNVHDLSTIMIMASSNKAAYTFEYHLPPSQFLAKMNQKAQELAMTDTVFTDASGLSAKNKISGDDLVKLVQYIWDNHRDIITVNQNVEAVIRELQTDTQKTISSTHKFAGRSDFLGGKTGFTESAQGNLVSIFEIENRPVLILVLGTEDRFGETEKILNFVTNASRSD